MAYFRIHFGIKGLIENTDIIEEENKLKAKEVAREAKIQEIEFYNDFDFDFDVGYSWAEEITKEDLTEEEKRLETFYPIFDE